MNQCLFKKKICNQTYAKNTFMPTKLGGKSYLLMGEGAARVQAQ